MMKCRLVASARTAAADSVTSRPNHGLRCVTAVLAVAAWVWLAWSPADAQTPGAAAVGVKIEQMLKEQPIEQPPQLDPMSGQPMPAPPMSSVPIDELLDNHKVEFEECQRWASDDPGQEARIQNPAGFANVRAHALAHQMAMMKEAMMNAPPPMPPRGKPSGGPPPPPAPGPSEPPPVQL